MQSTIRPDLRALHGTAARETYCDGLLELVVAGLLLIVAVASGRPAFAWLYLVALLLLGPGLEKLKARFTYPRIGYVQLESEDPKRLRRGMAAWVIGVVLLVGLALTVAGELTNHLTWRRAAPGIAGLLFAGGLLYVAQRSHFVRHYVLAATSVVVGVLAATPTESTPYANLRVWAFVMAILSIAMGLVVLFRFIKSHPVITDRTPDDE
jgi:hypothetical protein